MNLTRRDDGVVLLAGEPIEDWYKSRGIMPVEMQYVEVTGAVTKMCLIGAIGYAAVENRMSIDTYKEEWDNKMDSGSNIVAMFTGDTRHDIQELEYGFLSRGSERKVGPMQNLGYDARMQLIKSYGEIPKS